MREHCSVCGASTDALLCSRCFDVKHFTCHCCNERFSYNELVKRGINLAAKYKCKNPDLKKIQCNTCKKGVFLITKNGYQCLNCVVGEWNIEKLSQQIIYHKEEFDRKLRNIRIITNDIQLNFNIIQTIRDPIAQNGTLQNYLEIMRINNHKLEKAKDEFLNNENQMQVLTKILETLICYKAAYTFLLCGLRPEVLRYIPKQIHKNIVRWILRSTFLIGF